MDDKSCFLFGHRNADEGLLPALELVIEELIRQEGVCRFYVGHYGGFDRAAAAALRRAKQRHPHITVMLVLPYLPTGADLLPQGFDGTYWPEGMESTPRRYAIVRANRLLVDLCGFLVCHVVSDLATPGGCCPMPAAGTPPAGSAIWPGYEKSPAGRILRGSCYGTQKGQAEPVLFFRCRSRIV